MKRQILAVTIGMALVAAVLTPTLSSNNAFAQVTAESRVLQAILGLTDQIKQQTTQTKAKYQDTIFDLNLKKKFWHFEPVEGGTFGSTSTNGTIIGFGVFGSCDDGDFKVTIDNSVPIIPDNACAFQVESIQLLDEVNGVIGVMVVDGVPTDIPPGIQKPSNLLVDTGWGRIGASQSVAILGAEFEGTFPGFGGEKPQGMSLSRFVVVAEIIDEPILVGEIYCIDDVGDTVECSTEFIESKSWYYILKVAEELY